MIEDFQACDKRLANEEAEYSESRSMFDKGLDLMRHFVLLRAERCAWRWEQWRRVNGRLKKQASQMLDDFDAPGSSRKSRSFISDRPPTVGWLVELLCGHAGQSEVLPLLAAWTGEYWIVAGTQRKITYEIIGWRRPLSPANGRDKKYLAQDLVAR